MKNIRGRQMNPLFSETSIISSALAEDLLAVISKTQLAMRTPCFVRLDLAPTTNFLKRALFISKEEMTI